MANHKKFQGPPKVGHDRPDHLPHPAQIGRGHLAAGSPLTHVAQLGDRAQLWAVLELLVVCHPGRRTLQVMRGQRVKFLLRTLLLKKNYLTVMYAYHQLSLVLDFDDKFKDIFVN